MRATLKKVAFVAALMLAVNAHAIEPAAKPVIKIGVMAPLSGEYAHYGQNLVHGIQMALEDSKASNHYDYQLVIEDDQFQKTKMPLIANKFINVDKVDAVINLWDHGAFVIGPVMEQKRIPHICVGWSADVLKAKCTHSFYSNPAVMGETLGHYVAGHGQKRVAMLLTNFEGYVNLCNGFDKGAKAASGAIVNRQSFVFGTKDFRTIIAKAMAEKPDAIFLCSISPDMDILLQQIRETKTTLPIYAIESVEEAPNLKLYEGVTFVRGGAPNQKLEDRYRTEFYGEKLITFGEFAYDAGHTLVDAFEKVDPKGNKKEEVLSYLANLKTFDGKAGSYKQTPERYFHGPAVLRKVVDGKLELVKD